jgi:hypothetical protein
MRGALTFNGWQHLRGTVLRPGLISNSYRNREGWTAQEVYAGPKDRFLHLQVNDERGAFIGTVKSVAELP